MSQPKLPEKSNFTREDVINQILTSIAMEELGLSHVINAEGEKLQYVLGTIEGVTGPPEPATVDDLLELNKSIRETLGDTIHIQMLLKSKLERALAASIMHGPPGPPGGVGVILDSYDSLEELKKEHEKGNQGDAYLVGGELYVWDVDSGDWASVGSLLGPTGPAGSTGPIGPTGPTGPVGVILDSYESLVELKEEHETGRQGDAYLVGGELYIWDVAAANWKLVGKLAGPTGPVGPRGRDGQEGPPGAAGPQGVQGEAGTIGTIKAVFATEQDLRTAHQTGNPGDLYYIDPDLWIWDVDKNDWANAGKIAGPQGTQGLPGERGEAGPTGPTGPVCTISGSYDTLAELKKDNPKGTQGETYLLVGGEIYTWDEHIGDWDKKGNILGPTGPTGATGPTGPHGVGTLIKGNYTSLADLKREHPDGPPEEAYLIAGELYIWDAVKGWHSAGSLRSEAVAHTIIPFASTEAPRTYSINGNPSRVSLIGFGYGDRRGEGTLNASNYSIIVDSTNYSFTLNKANSNDNKQVVFSLPFNMVLKSIHITVGNWGDFSPPGKVYPYIQLYSAKAGTNNFTVIPEAVAMPEDGLGPGSVQPDTMLSASKENLSVKLKAGTRIAIGAMMKTEGSTAQQDYWLYFTGGIGLAYDPNPDI